MMCQTGVMMIAIFWILIVIPPVLTEFTHESDSPVIHLPPSLPTHLKNSSTPTIPQHRQPLRQQGRKPHSKHPQQQPYDLDRHHNQPLSHARNPLVRDFLSIKWRQIAGMWDFFFFFKLWSVYIIHNIFIT